MGDKATRSSLTEVKKAYDHFFHKGWTLAKIKDAALGDKLFPSPIPTNGTIGIPGRSIAWKLFLLGHEPLETSPVRADALLEAVRMSRKAYKELLLEKMKAPDGSYDADLVLPGTVSASVKEWMRKRKGLPSDVSHANFVDDTGGVASMTAAAADMHLRSGSSSNLELNNPLSLHNENPWNSWFVSVELRKTILQDVERTFPDIAYFRRQDVQLQLTNMLFLFSVQHPSIGYRQGMHELLAPLYHAVAFDALPEEEGITINADPSLKDLCSSLWVAADAWALFEAVMRGVSRWYEWQEPSGSLPDPLVTSATTTNGPGGRNSPLPAYTRFDVGESGMRPYIAPIVQTCNIIQGTLIRTTDPQLFSAIQGSGLEPQIYGIRWLRLLFTREFSMPDALRLWDGLFACDPTFDLAQWVCVAMLIRIRNDLILADYSGQLTLVLRYPSPPNASTPTPHHAILLLRQALALQMAPTPAAGASLILENRSILEIPVEIPTSASSPIGPRGSGRGHLTRQQIASAPGRDGGSVQGYSRIAPSSSMGLPEMIARGLIERGESLGINKTFSSALTELKRNIPDLAASLVRPTSQAEMAFPLEDERPPQERPPWEPKTRFEMERDMNRKRARDKRIGDSLGWIVDALLQDEESEDKERLKKQKREAIESLAYIRDVLISEAIELEDDRLLGEEETLRRRVQAKRQVVASSAPPIGLSSSSRISRMIAPPTPLPVIDSRPKRPGSRLVESPPTKPIMQALTTTNTEAPVSGGPALAPWNYTRSSFSGLPTTAVNLPRPPPPTSRNLRQTGERSGDQTPVRGEDSSYSDPLGAMP